MRFAWQDHHVDKIVLHPLYTQKQLTQDMCGDNWLEGVAHLCSKEQLDTHDEL